MHTGRFPDGGLIYPAMPFGSYTKVTRADCDAIFAYLRSVPPVQPAEPAARPALPVQQPPTHPGLAHAVLPGRRIPAGPDQIGRVEPRRLSRRGAGPLRDVPLADQRARRQLRVEGVRGRADPDAELVRALAHLEQGGGARRVEHRGDRRSAAQRGVATRRRLRPDGGSHVQQPAISERCRCARHGDLSEEPWPRAARPRPRSPEFRRPRAAC